ncbi:hypothetical protein EV421DRAFT_2022975 [Armillaria borealis]|uniref:Uncharacterized protein n=1 Tax=Armillaria borealis TaxID=47425 RepID=A0AA39J357_9AGAR|nr:hypothetical protein EV421DRAFT_2022975 [Armillaria borealis]
MFARISLLALPLLASAGVIPIFVPRNDIGQLYPVICPNAPPIPVIAREDSFVITARQIPALPAPPAPPTIPAPPALPVLTGRQITLPAPPAPPAFPAPPAIPVIPLPGLPALTGRQITLPAPPAPPAIPVIPLPARLCMIASRQNGLAFLGCAPIREIFIESNRFGDLVKSIRLSDKENRSRK